jgi:ABC-type sugar transport system substrate-binding protein
MSKLQRYVAVIVGLVGIVAAVAACGGSSSSSSGSSTGGSSGSATSSANLTEAEALVEKAMQKPEELWFPIKSEKPLPKGPKYSLVFIHCGVATCNGISDAIESAIEGLHLGWKYTVLHTDGTPQSVKEAWEAAARMKPNVIAMNGFSRSLIEKQLKELHEDGTTYINFGTTDEFTSEFTPENTILRGTPADEAPQGQLQAAWVATDSKCEGGDVLDVELPLYETLKGVNEEVKNSLAKYCPNVTVSSLAIPASALGTSAATKIVSYVRANPDIKYIVYGIDVLAPGVPAQLKAAGLNDIRSIGLYPSPENVSMIENGEETASVDLDEFAVYASYPQIGAFGITGQSLAPFNDEKKYPIPLQLITNENADFLQTSDSVFPSLFEKVEALFPAN